MKSKSVCACGGLHKYAEGGRTRVPTKNAKFIDAESESMRGRGALAALKGYAGAERPSVMIPGAGEAYEGGELAGLAEALIPGAAMGKGLLGAAFAGVMKNKGGNWLTGHVEHTLSDLIRNPSHYDDDLVRFGYADRIPEGREALYPRNEALNRWIQGPLTKYVKRDMATPDDPVRKLAEEGVLHHYPEAMPHNMERVYTNREKAGFPLAQGTSPLAQRWEAYADQAVEPLTLDQPIVFGGKEKMRGLVTSRPGGEWALDAPGNTAIYDLRRSRLGFDHLVDELSNAMDPASGLPRNLLLRPEQMQQMGMDRAVRHVDAINKWRAAEAEKAALEESATAGTHGKRIREYPDSDLKWIELAAPEKIDDTVKLRQNDDGTWSPLDLKGNVIMRGRGKDAEEVVGSSPEEAHLGGMLAVEGNIMGHCVGGYCPDVMEGRSRIFSLRDAKGEPHVTVEVKPRSRISGKLIDGIEPGLWDKIIADKGHLDVRKWLTNNRPDVFEKLTTPSIVQVKGKQNLKPKDEYLPFVQDFVRNSPISKGWDDVRDLSNAGLVRNREGRYITPEEDNAELRNYIGNAFEPDYANGGLVTNDTLARIILAYNGL